MVVFFCPVCVIWLFYCVTLIQTDRPLRSSRPGCASPRLFLSNVTKKGRIRLTVKRDKRDREAKTVIAPTLNAKI